ncbi:Neuroglobin [Atta colombica]|uniref:Neuroglobin n=1 Tax=Atta colombica TaxID=520822 RepID=A0A195BJ91_9HYME|nr:Neuroglobin [Atta colombica]
MRIRFISVACGGAKDPLEKEKVRHVSPILLGLLKRMDHIRQSGKLFEENAELLNMFTKFRDQKTKEQQSTSMELAEHAKTVMTTLDEGIKSLDDMDAFLTYLHEVGASHTKIPGFNRQYFWKIEKPFLDAVERTLEDRYSENVENIYKLTIKFIIETLIDGFDKAQSDKAKS